MKIKAGQFTYQDLKHVLENIGEEYSSQVVNVPTFLEDFDEWLFRKFDPEIGLSWEYLEESMKNYIEDLSLA